MAFISLKAPFLGYTNKWYKNTNPTGDAKQASVINSVDLTDPYSLKQGPGLAALTGTNTSELIRAIIDYTCKPGPLTYGISATKLWELSNTAITADATWPHAITNATDGRSVILFSNAIYYFYNKSSGSDIGKYDLATTFDDDWGTTNDGTAVWQQGEHPVCDVGGVMFFGNGQYVGTFTGTTLDANNYDLGAGNSVQSITYDKGRVYVACNNPNISGAKGKATIFIINPAVVSTDVEDFIFVGGTIGALYAKDGIVYVFHKRDTDVEYKLGYLNGNSIARVADYETVMPNQNQITSYQDGILFGGGSKIYLCVPANSAIIYPMTATTYSTSYGAISSPFGTPIICSASGSVRDVSKFSNYTITSDWTSVMLDVSSHKTSSTITDMSIETDTLASGAKCDITFYLNKSGSAYSRTFTIDSTTGVNNIHYFPIGITGVKDFKIKLSFANGSTTVPCPIREIILNIESYGRK